MCGTSDDLSATVNYQTETMSGASPWYTIKDADERVVQVMSGASIEDKRTDLSVNINARQSDKQFGFTVARSDEDDYESLSFAGSYSQDSTDKLSTWTLAADFSNDDLTPVDSGLFSTRPASGSKHSASMLASYSRILNKTTMVQFGFGYIDKSGFLSDPYKVVFVEGQLIGDNRPDGRTAKTFFSRLRFFSEAANGALHLDYRYYTDNWEIDSHTIDLAWYQNIADDWQLIPSVRLYSQTSSFFYENFYESVRVDGFHSTDYRLSEYGAVTYGLKLEKQLNDWTFNILAEKYHSSGNLGFADADVENPALLDFTLLSFGLNYKF
ncbi:MAG: DUF3570 domain-containing protein [Alteromonadaceae bacterium]|nr:DUF3570 domain-containing protein [Alteromonadaceae bacterium]